MKQLHDLETFTNILIEKGYNGYFHTESSYAGKLKDSISAFLEASEKGQDAPLVANKLYLNTYLQWNGEDNPKIECNMWVKFENGYFDLQETEIVIKKTDSYGKVVKQSKLSNLKAGSFPTVKEAIAQVSEKPKEQRSARKRGFRM